MSQEDQAGFDIVRLYTKNASLESPNAPESFNVRGNPDIQIQLSNEERNVEEDFYEVTLKITVTAKMEKQVLFIAEVEQAGLFVLAGFTEEQRNHLKGAYCPNILYPYVRKALDDLITSAGFPPVVLAPLNFEAIYAERQAQIAANKEGDDKAKKEDKKDTKKSEKKKKVDA